jgi:hypothetical protein
MFSRIINLDSRTDRWDRLKHLAAKYPELNIQRFSAKKPESDELLSLRAYSEEKSGQMRRSHESIRGKGAQGCSMSHIAIWKEFLASNAEFALVLEDDISTSVDLGQMVQDFVQDTDWDVGLLGWCGSLHRFWGNARGSTVIPFPASCGYAGSHAYMLRRKSAEILLKDALPLEMQIDYYIQAQTEKKNLKMKKTSRKKIRQVWAGGSDVFTVCYFCEPKFFLLGIIFSFLISLFILKKYF